MSNATTATSADEATTTATDLMVMVVTLKSGVQIRTRVTEFAIRRSTIGEFVGLKWVTADGADPGAVLHYLDTNEVAAVHEEDPDA